MHGIKRRTNLRLVFIVPGIDAIVLVASNEQLRGVFLDHQVRGQGPLDTVTIDPWQIVDDIERLPLGLDHLAQLDSSYPVSIRQVARSILGETSFINNTIGVTYHVSYD